MFFLKQPLFCFCSIINQQLRVRLTYARQWWKKFVPLWEPTLAAEKFLQNFASGANVKLFEFTHVLSIVVLNELNIRTQNTRIRLLHCGLDFSGEKPRQKPRFQFQYGGFILHPSNKIRCVLEDLSIFEKEHCNCQGGCKIFLCSRIH